MPPIHRGVLHPMTFLASFVLMCVFVFGIAWYLRRQRDKESAAPARKSRSSITVGPGAKMSNVHLVNADGDIKVKNCRAGRHVEIAAGDVSVMSSDEGTVVTVAEGGVLEGTFNGQYVKVEAKRGEGPKRVVIPK